MSEFILPAKPDIERLVLGSVLLRGDRYEMVSQCITRDDFTNEKHRILFDAFASLHEQGRGIDRVTVSHRLQEMAPGVWTLSELASLDDELPDLPQIDGYLDLISDTATRRRAILSMSELAHALAEGRDTKVSLQKAERIAQELSGVQSGKATLLDVSAIVERGGGLQRVMEPHTLAPSSPMPWMPLCRIFEGLAPGRLTLLAARPGDGKTTFALQVIHHAASIGKRVALFSLEMGGVELLQRMACILASVNLQKFLRGRCATEEDIAISRRLGELASLPIVLDDANAVTVGAIRRAIVKAKQKPELLVIDYLQLLEVPSRSRQRYEQLGEITRGLKILAREMDVSILALSQLTRANEHEKRAPELRDLRESGSLEQDADSVLMLHHLTQGEQRGVDHPVKVLVRKQRMGPLGEATLMWDAKIARFDEPIVTDRWQDEAA